MDTDKKPVYSTWIRTKKIRFFWAVSIFLLAGPIALGFLSPAFLLLGLLSIPFFYISIIITLTAKLFSASGGGFQTKIHDLIIEAVNPSGSILDIGCGSGHLAIKLAKLTSSPVTGIDFWGDDWEYSQKQCQRNAELEGVANIGFQKASASQLPFTNGSIDNVVSCLTFHEVQDVANKVDSLAEALRVLSPGGRFVFFDLFDDPTHYAGRAAIRTALEKGGGQIISERKLSEIMKLPYPLDTKKVLRYAVLIVGDKKSAI